ncbi:MAG: hypothetical protein OQK71_02870, partial [Desulfobacter sp.]|nr:hypothetical protein [Desulfobacter sp.]
DCGLSRVLPVVLGTATTILGVVALVQNAFWVSMALVMMVGCLLGTVLTVVLVPTLYTHFAGLYHPSDPGICSTAR